MSAKVVRVFVGAGDAVKEGDTLVVVEAMKMEMPIVATQSGIVQEVYVKEGEHVQPNELLVVVD